MSKQTAENVILSQTLVKNHTQIQLLLFDSYYAIFHLCEFSLVPKCAYLEDPLYCQWQKFRGKNYSKW